MASSFLLLPVRSCPILCNRSRKHDKKRTARWFTGCSFSIVHGLSVLVVIIIVILLIVVIFLIVIIVVIVVLLVVVIIVIIVHEIHLLIVTSIVCLKTEKLYFKTNLIF